MFQVHSAPVPPLGGAGEFVLGLASPSEMRAHLGLTFAAITAPIKSRTPEVMKE